MLKACVQTRSNRAVGTSLTAAIPVEGEMPRYYFDLINSAGGRSTDVEGLHFSSLEAAKQDAKNTLTAMAAYDLRRHDDFDTKIEIRDTPSGQSVLTVSLLGSVEEPN